MPTNKALLSLISNFVDERDELKMALTLILATSFEKWGKSEPSFEKTRKALKKCNHVILSAKSVTD